MKKLLVILLAFLSILFSSSTLAEGFNDSYLQIGFGSSSAPTLENELISSIVLLGDEPRISGDKIADQTIDISGSIDLGNNFSIIGGYVRETGDWKDSSADYSNQFGTCCLRTWDATTTEFSLGFGKNFDINANNLGDVILSYTQLTTSLSAVKVKSDLTSTRPNIGNWDEVSLNKNFNIFSLGVRTISNFDIELGAKYNRLAGGGVKFDQFEVEAMKYFNKDIALGAAVAKQKNGTKMGVFVRKSF